MIGRHERGSAAVSCEALQSQITVEVDVIEAEDRKPSGESSGFLQMATDVRLVEMLGQRMRHRASQPFIKVSEDNSRPVQFFIHDNPFIEELASLFALFEESRSEVDVEDMKRLLVEADVGSKAAAPFSSSSADVVVLVALYGKARQDDVPVTAALVALILAKREMEPQFTGDKSSLILLA